ncbi:hypothetical protein BQ8420_17755 [Nocardiopsis sp. JB363]|nr:hypothetical protein BQ8420_17755 [Nocardiopsis sp. JB363]
MHFGTLCPSRVHRPGNATTRPTRSREYDLVFRRGPQLAGGPCERGIPSAVRRGYGLDDR